MASCGQPNGADSKVLADVLALLAGANEIEHTTADGVLGDIAGVAHLRERTHVAGAGAGDDLAPVGVIGLGELREEPLQGAVCGILNLVGQLDAVGLLPAAEKDLRAADDVTEQFLNAVPGDFQMGLDGLAGLDGLRRGGRAVGVQRFLSGDVRGDGLPQFLVVEPRQVAEEQRAVDAGGTGVIQDRFFVVAPSVPHPQGDLVAAGSRTAGGKLEDEFARLAGGALLQRYGLERLLGSVAEQFRTLGIDALVVIEGGGAAAVEVVRPDARPRGSGGGIRIPPP